MNENDRPAPEVFRQLAARLPGFVKEATEKDIAGGLKVPCGVCGKHYGAVLAANRKPCCPACTTLLKDGWCAFVTVDANAHQFFRHNEMPQDWAGQVFTVPADRLDAIQKRFEELKSQNEN